MNTISSTTPYSGGFANRTSAAFILAAVLACLAGTSSAQLENYDSVWVKLYPASLEILSTHTDPPPSVSPMFKDFLEAAASQNVDMAILRWKHFTEKYPQLNDAFEDSVHKRYWEWAQCELARSRLLKADDQTAALELEEAMRKFATEQDGDSCLLSPASEPDPT